MDFFYIIQTALLHALLDTLVWIEFVRLVWETVLPVKTKLLYVLPANQIHTCFNLITRVLVHVEMDYMLMQLHRHVFIAQLLAKLAQALQLLVFLA